MTFRASVDRFKEVRVSQKELLWLGIGVVAGLVLGLLIGWVWWPVDWQAGSAAAIPTEVATPVVAVEPVAAAEETANDGSGNVLGALFQLLLGLVVVGIGAYVVWLFVRNQRSSARTSQPSAATVSSVTVSPTSVSPAYTPASAPPPTVDPISPYSPTSPAPRPAPPPAAYSAAQAAATRVSPVQPPAMSNVPPFEREEDAAPPPPASARSQPISPSVAVTAAAADVSAGSATGSKTTPVEQAAPSAAAGAAGQRAPAPSTGWQAGPARVSQYKTIDRFAATFTAGMEDFNVSKNIPGPNEELYLGEYGLGISERHGMLNNDPDQVVAIEVYIFDKSDDKHLVNVSRVLLSEYADTHLRKHFEREKDRLGPIVAQPNTTLQLEARQFVLLCTITDVRYSHDGIFERMTIDMELKDKRAAESA